MCGISAIITLNAVQQPASHSELEQSLRASLDHIKHRGPDGVGTWISSDRRVALGHVRLAINDRTTDGIQPFHHHASGVHIIVNGEFYEHQLIRQQFPSYPFSSQSDSEVLIPLYCHLGPTRLVQLLRQLRGEFAFCLYDAHRQLFLAVRDRYGTRPLFWTVVNNRLLVASEAKAFLPLGWQPTWDVESIVRDLWVSGSKTLFEGVSKVLPGWYMSCEALGAVQWHQWWKINFPDQDVHAKSDSEDDIVLQLRHRLIDSIRVRMQEDARQGIFLSGGLDSSAVAGIMTRLLQDSPSLGQEAERMKLQAPDSATSVSRLMTPPVTPVERSGQVSARQSDDRLTCFTVSFEGHQGVDEGDVARRTAEALGLRLVVQDMDEVTLARDFEAAAYSLEQLNPDLNFVGMYTLSRRVAEEKIRIVHTGKSNPHPIGKLIDLVAHGSDDFQLGYPHMINSSGHGRVTADHGVLKEATVEAGYHAADPGSCLRLSDRPATLNVWSMMSPVMPWSEWVNTFSSVNTVSERSPGLHAKSITSLLRTDIDNLNDRPTMAGGQLESRTPFLDDHVTDLAISMPPSLKIQVEPVSGRVVRKAVLLKAAEPFITPEVFQREKKAYLAPVAYDREGPLHLMMKRLLSRQNIADLGFLQFSRLMRHLDQGFGPQTCVSSWRVLVLAAMLVVIGRRFKVARATPGDRVQVLDRKVDQEEPGLETDDHSACNTT